MSPSEVSTSELLLQLHPSLTRKEPCQLKNKNNQPTKKPQGKESMQARRHQIKVECSKTL